MGQSQRNSGATPLSAYLAAMGVLALFVAVVVWLATSPMDGRGTISQTQLQDSYNQNHQTQIHGFRHLREGEASDQGDAPR